MATQRYVILYDGGLIDSDESFASIAKAKEYIEKELLDADDDAIYEIAELKTVVVGKPGKISWSEK